MLLSTAGKSSWSSRGCWQGQRQEVEQERAANGSGVTIKSPKNAVGKPFRYLPLPAVMAVSGQGVGQAMGGCWEMFRGCLGSTQAVPITSANIPPPPTPGQGGQWPQQGWEVFSPPVQFLPARSLIFLCSDPRGACQCWGFWGGGGC